MFRRGFRAVSIGTVSAVIARPAAVTARRRWQRARGALGQAMFANRDMAPIAVIGLGLRDVRENSR
jgi:hypothetical protein